MLDSSVSMSSRYCRYIRATRSAIAAKKAIVSAVSTTSRKFPPPGSSSKNRATSAMRPNFQAVCTTGTVSGLMDRAAGGQRQHQHAQRDPVHHEHDRRMAGHVPQQERDRPVADHERQD